MRLYSFDEWLGNPSSSVWVAGWCAILLTGAKRQCDSRGRRSSLARLSRTIDLAMWSVQATLSVGALGWVQ